VAVGLRTWTGHAVRAVAALDGPGRGYVHASSLVQARGVYGLEVVCALWRGIPTRSEG
jgi:hypothetical protein